MLRAVVFDFDGVIANSEPLHFRAFQDILSIEGVAFTEADYYSRYLGYDDAGVFDALSRERRLGWRPAEVAGLVARKAVRLEELEKGGAVLFHGARELITCLAATLPLAIASGARRDEIVRVIEHERLARFFRALVAAEDTLVSKPAPDAYRLAVERLGATTELHLLPGECIAIEDSRWGLESARRAGLKTVAVAHTYSAAELSADLVVPNLPAITLEALHTIVM